MSKFLKDIEQLTQAGFVVKFKKALVHDRVTIEMQHIESKVGAEMEVTVQDVRPDKTDEVLAIGINKMAAAIKKEL